MVLVLFTGKITLCVLKTEILKVTNNLQNIVFILDFWESGDQVRKWNLNSAFQYTKEYNP